MRIQSVHILLTGASSLVLILVLAAVKCSIVCDTESPGEAAVWNGTCQDEETALVNLDTSSLPRETTIDVYFNDSNKYKIISETVVPGFIVFSLPKSLFTSNTTGIVIEEPSTNWSCSSNILLNPTMNTLVLFSNVWATDQVNTVKALVKTGRGVSFAFTILKSVNNSLQMEQVSIIKACNMSSVEATLQFIPTSVALYTVNVTAFMDQRFIEAGFQVMSGYPIARGSVVFGPNCTSHQGHYYPGDNINIIINSLDGVQPNRPTSPNCTIDWGDNTVFNEEDADLRPDQDTKIMYSQSHTYNTTGNFLISLRCHNLLSEVKQSLNVRVESPSQYANVVLQNTVLPLSSVSQEAKGVLIFAHAHLKDDYPQLHITVDFGLLNTGLNFNFTYPLQPIEHIYKQKGNYTLIVTFESFGVANVVNLALKVGVFDFYIKYRPPTVLVNHEHVFELVRFVKDGDWSVRLNFDPEITTEIFPDKKVFLNVSHSYKDAGIKKAIASVEVNGTVEEAVFEFTTYAGCIESTDLFEVTYRHELTPLLVLMSDMQTVAGRIKRSALCNRTENFIFEWHVSINAGSAPVYVWDSIQISQPETVNLILNNFIYKAGLYKIMLLVTTEEKLTVSDHMFLQVVQPPLVANILGGTFTQHSIDKLLILDAESVSYDPVSINPEHSNLSFTWACFMLTSEFDVIEYLGINANNLTHEIKSPCPLPTLPNQGLIIITTTNFKDRDLVLFEVTTHRLELQETAVEVVQMLRAQIPAVIIQCIWNCGAKLVTHERTLLTANIRCLECDDLEMHNAKYQWSLFILDSQTGDIANVSWNENIMSEHGSKSFDSEGGWWKPGTMYIISVTVEVGTLSSVTTSRMLFTNLEPYNGTCHVEPQEGVAGETEFVFSFPGWKDEDKRSSRDPVVDVNALLLYNVQQRTDVETPFIYAGAEISTQRTILPACNSVNDWCSVDITVSDPFGGKSTCTVLVKVSYNEFSNANATKEKQFQMLLQNLEMIRGEMDHTVLMGDPVKIAQDAATYSTILNSMNLVDSPQASHAGQKFNIANITSRDTLLFLLDPVVITPSQDTLSLAMHQLILDIGHAIEMAAERHLDVVRHLIIFAKSLVTATSHHHLLTGKSLQDVSALAARLSAMLIAHTDGLRLMGDVGECLEAIAQLQSNIIETCAIDPSRLDPDTSIFQDSGLSSREMTYLAKLLAKRESYAAFSIKEHAPEIVKNSLNVWENLFNVCRQLEYYNGTYEVKTEAFSATVKKITKEDVLRNKTVMIDSFLVNSFFLSNIDMEDSFSPIHIQVLRSKNIFTHGMHSNFITSEIFSASAVSDNGTKLNMTAPGIVYDAGVDDCTVGANVKVIEPNFTEDDAAFLFYHSFKYLDTNAHVCVTVKPSVDTIFYRMYVKTGSEPTDLNYDYRITLSLETLRVCRETCIPADKLRRVGKVYIGLRPLLAPAVVTKRRKRQVVGNPFIASYLFGITTVACYNWEAQKVDWEASRCKVTHTNRTVTCICLDGPDLISALSFHFAPNLIHFPTVFSKFDIKSQGEVIGVLLTIYFLFLLGSIWAHHKDRKGIFQWGVFPLEDNYADEEYFYLIAVHTGLRKSAGTKSKVSFCLYGELSETGVRQLTDGIREGFPSASMLYFVMACPGSLGPLQCLRIWIDNSEKSGDVSWYLARIDVTDIQTGHTYFFVCEEWLAPEKNSMDKMIEASSMKDLQSLKSALVFNTRKHITDEHIWLSVFIRPEWSRFSRGERLGCCLTFLLLAMITSAMFYRGAPDVDRQRPSAGLEIGPVKLSFQQLYYSLVSAVISAIPIAALVTIFRKARNTSDMAVKSTNACCSKLPWMAKMEKQLAQLEKILLIKPDAEEMERTWPHCLRYVAWILVFLVTSVCSFFIILYTIEWGKDVTEEWLSSFMLAFIESLFVVDPFKVLLVSFLLSICIRKTKVKGVDWLNLQHILQVNKEYGIKKKTDPARKSVSFLPAVPEEELQAATHKRKIHIMIRNTLWELTIHCIFLLIVCSLCYSNRTTQTYHLYSTVYKGLVGQKATGFNSVNTPAEYFTWLETVLVPWLFPEKDYTGQSIISEDRHYTSVWSLYRIGAPRLRQVRMKKGGCMYDSINTGPCVDKYSIIQEETSESCLGWSQIPCLPTDQLHVSAGAWYYRSDISILELPLVGEYNTYGGKGYIVNLDINLIIVTAIIEEMKRYFWVDRQTRAVIVEFTMYCPNVNHFIDVTLLAEFLETGEVVPFASIYPFSVYDPPGVFGTYVLVCEILYIFFTVFGFVYVLFIFSREKWAALKNYWFLVDFAAVIVAVITAFMFYLRLSSAKIALSKLKDDWTQFISFQQVVLWDRGVAACLGFLVAIAFFRLLKLAGYSEITIRVYHVLKLAVNIMPSFFVYMFLVIASFAFLGYGMFSHTSPYFKSFTSCLTTLFTGLMGHSSFKETNLPETDQWETILFFCLFVIICIMFLTNLFLAILLDILTLTAQKGCAAVNSDEAQIFALLWDSLLVKLRLKSDSVICKQKEDPPNVSTATPPAIIEPHDWADRLMLIASRMFNDHDGASVMQLITSNESKKLSIISNFTDLNDGESPS